MNPFPGLRPFEMQEKYLFFGREDQTVELLKRLGQARFMAVVGTSGSGKSSLVRAGLLPELHGGTMTDAGSSWEIAVMRPGGDPLTNLARSLEDSGIYDTDEEGYYRHLRAMLGRSTMGLVEAVSQSTLEKEDNLLIVVDQFEEIFRFRSSSGKHAEEAANFISLLLEATQQTGKSVFVTITMRSDFLGDCSQFRGLAEAVNEGEYLIPRLNRNQRRLAIEGPVKVGGKQIEARLVQQLLNDIGDDPDQLPILQHALMRTWEYHEKAGGEGALDLDDYEATGGMKEALSRHADEVYEELQSEEERIYCERIFKALTERVSGGRGIRRPMALSELAEVVGADDPNKLIPVIEAYRAAGRTFLMPPDSIALGPKIVIDISHESLMRVWQHLVGWVDEESQSARIYRRLADTAQLFKENKAGLYRDPDLQISLSWRDQNNPTEAWADRYYPGYKGAMAFLDESHETAIAEEKAKEEARKRELEQARRLAEEERRSKSLWQKLVWTFGVAVIAVAGGLYYIAESREIIRDNLSRVNLKEANRLVDSNQQDEAISLLAKTIEDNPAYEAASVRLLSLLDNTALPLDIQTVHSIGNGYNIINTSKSIEVYPKFNLITERSRKENRTRYRLIDLEDKKTIYEVESENALWASDVTNDGKYFYHMEYDRVSKMQLNIIEINSNNRYEVEISEGPGFDISKSGDVISYIIPESGFEIKSTFENRILLSYYPNTDIEGIPFRLALSPNGKFAILASKTKKGFDVKYFDIYEKSSRIIKKYDFDPFGVNYNFSNDLDSVFITSTGMKSDNYVSVNEMINIKSGSIIDLRAGMDGSPNTPFSFLNDGLIVSRAGGGGLAMSSYPFGNFKTLKGHSDGVYTVNLSHDGMIMATGSRDRTVRLWNTLNGEQLSSPIRFPGSIYSVKFSLDGRTIFVSVSNGTLYSIRYPFSKSEPTSRVFTAGGNNQDRYDSSSDKFSVLNSSQVLTMVDLKGNRTFSFKDLESGLLTRGGRRYYSYDVNWEKNIVRYLSTNQKTNIYLNTYNLDDNKHIDKYMLPSDTMRVSLSQGGQSISTISDKKIVSIVDSESKKLIYEPYEVDRRFYMPINIGNEDLLYAYGYSVGQFYDNKTGMKLGPLFDIARSRVSFLNKKKIYILRGGDSSVVYLCKNKLKNIIPLELGQAYESLVVDKSESLVAIATEDGRVSIWDIEEGVALSTLKHESVVDGMVFHPFNNRYLFTFVNGKIYGWDRNERNLFMGPVSISRGSGLFINSDGSILTAMGYSGRVYRFPIQIPEYGFDYSNWLPNLANSIVRYKVNSFGGYEEISDKELAILRNNSLRNVSGQNNVNWVNWLMSTNSNPNVNSIDNETRNDIVKSLVNSDNISDLSKALHLKPSDPLLLADFSYHLLMSGDPKLNKRRVSYYIGKARDLGVNNSAIYYRSAQIEEIFNNQMASLQYITRAIELNKENKIYLNFKKKLLQNN